MYTHHAPHTYIRSLSIHGIAISVNTWKQATALIRKTLTPVLKVHGASSVGSLYVYIISDSTPTHPHPTTQQEKRALVLAPPKPVDATPDTSSSTTETAKVAATAAAGGKKGGATKKKKTPASVAGKAKKGAATKPKKAAAVKKLPLSAAPSSLVRCTELRLSGGGTRLAKVRGWCDLVCR